MADKTYINGLFIKTHTFNDGGEIIKLAVKVEALVAELNQYQQDGWVNIDLCRRKEPSDKGHTHYAVLNLFLKRDGAERSGSKEGTASLILAATEDEMP